MNYETAEKIPITATKIKEPLDEPLLSLFIFLREREDFHVPWPDTAYKL